MHAVLDTLYKTVGLHHNSGLPHTDSNGGKLLGTIIQHEIMIHNSLHFL